MVKVRHYGPAATMPDGPVAVFQAHWQVYRKFIDHNYLNHREAYNCLHRVLVDDAVQPFRFMDVACGGSVATL
jgi:hypothetical protein